MPIPQPTGLEIRPKAASPVAPRPIIPTPAL